MSATTTSDADTNLKRERSDDEDTDIGSSPKILKRSDSERETTTSASAAENSDSGGKVIDAPPAAIIKQENDVSKQEETPAATNGTNSASSTVKEEKDVAKSETPGDATTPVAIPAEKPAPPTAADPTFVLDRSGNTADAPPNPSVPDSAPPTTTVVAAPPVDSNAVVEEKGEINIQIAGRVIGKGGEIIRDCTCGSSRNHYCMCRIIRRLTYFYFLQYKHAAEHRLM